MKGAESTHVAARSRRCVHSGAEVRYLVDERPGYGCQLLSLGDFRFQ